MTNPIDRASQITVGEFTEAVFTSVMRAIDAQRAVDPKTGAFTLKNPIIYGIWIMPENLAEKFQAPQIGARPE